MSKKLKKKEFHFSFTVLIRWLIFTLIIYFSINYLSRTKSQLNPQLNQVPKLNLSILNNQPVIIDLTNQFNSYKDQAVNIINHQIIEIKKQVVTDIYQNILKNIDNSQK